MVGRMKGPPQGDEAVKVIHSVGVWFVIQVVGSGVGDSFRSPLCLLFRFLDRAFAQSFGCSQLLIMRMATMIAMTMIRTTRTIRR